MKIIGNVCQPFYKSYNEKCESNESLYTLNEKNISDNQSNKLKHQCKYFIDFF